MLYIPAAKGRGRLKVAKDYRISLLLDFYGAMLTEKQRDVVELYYNEDLSLAEIAEHSRITRQGVRDSIKRAEVQLLDYESRLGLYARFEEMQKTLGEIIRLSQDIDELSARSGGNAEIAVRAGRIEQLAGGLTDE